MALPVVRQEIAAALNPLDAFVVDPERVKSAAAMAQRAREFAALRTDYLDVESIAAEVDDAGEGGGSGRSAAPRLAATAPTAAPIARAVSPLVAKRPRLEDSAV